MKSKENLKKALDGYLLWDDSSAGHPGLQQNQILLRGNTNYFKRDDTGKLDLGEDNKPIFDPEPATLDINREILIDAIPYKILSIKYSSGDIVIILDREIQQRLKRVG